MKLLKTIMKLGSIYVLGDACFQIGKASMLNVVLKHYGDSIDFDYSKAMGKAIQETDSKLRQVRLKIIDAFIDDEYKKGSDDQSV